MPMKIEPSMARPVINEFPGKEESYKEIGDSKKAIVPAEYRDSQKSLKSQIIVRPHDQIDTIVSLHKAKRKGPQAGVFNDFINFIKGIFGGKKASEDQSVSEKNNRTAEDTANRPILEKPGHDELNGMEDFSSEMTQLMHNVKVMKDQVDDLIAKNPTIKGGATLKLITELMQLMRSSQENSADVSKEIISKLMEDNRQIQREYIDGKQSLDKQKKASDVLGWVNTAVGAVIGITTLATIAIATICSLGAAAAPVAAAMAAVNAGITALGAGASLAGGASTITKGVVDYDNGKKLSKLLEMKEIREMNNAELTELVKELNRAFDAIQSLWDNQRTIVQNTYDIARVA